MLALHNHMFGYCQNWLVLKYVMYWAGTFFLNCTKWIAVVNIIAF